nr:SHOCT domain-containing protein [Campylobacter hyointestinalis]
MVYEVNDINNLERSLSQTQNLKNIEKLYDLYQSGAISKDEFERRKASILD